MFALLDLLVGVSMRAAGIANPAWRATYYVFAFGCWWLMRSKPRLTPVIGIGESAVNLLLLLLSILGPIYAATATVAEGGDPVLGFGPGRILNVFFAGTILILGFHGYQNRLAGSLGTLDRVMDDVGSDSES